MKRLILLAATILFSCTALYAADRGKITTYEECKKRMAEEGKPEDKSCERFFLNRKPVINKYDVDGFRGIKWGTEISELTGFTKVRSTATFGGVDIYSRQGDDLNIGAATIDRIEYEFWNGKLASVSMYTVGSSNFDALLGATMMKFGAGWQPNKYIPRYFWRGDVTEIFLEHNKVRGTGMYHMYSTSTRKEQRAFDLQRAKDGAAKGF